MKLTEGRDNENSLILSEEPGTSSQVSQEKVTLKRKILNPFKRLSLKRSKSYAQRFRLINSDSSLSLKYDNSHIESQQKPKINHNIFQETRVSYTENNPFHSKTNIPYQAACTSKTIQSLVIFPNDASDIQRNMESIHHPAEAFDDRPLHIIFNPADLPALSDWDRNHIHSVTSQNESQVNYTKLAFDSKSSQTQQKIKSIQKKIKKSVNEMCNIVPTNYISNNSNHLITNLTLGLKEILDIINYLQENELHLKRVISKYIRNENLEQELLQAVEAHAKIQMDNERRAHKLAQEIFFQEKERLQAKENVLRNSLEVVVQINRLLEEEIESLKSENEKIVVEYDDKSHSCANHQKYEQDILKNNNELRARLKHLLNEVHKLEFDLKNLQAENEYLVNQLATANSQIHTYKDMLQKSMGDHEIEQAALLQQLSNNEQILKASIDAGDTLMEDLEAIKRQLKQMPFTLNWSKFRSRGSTVVDLLHLARSCINELCRELINTYMQITVHHKDNETQNIEISKLNQELLQFKTNDLHLQSKIEDLSSLDVQLQVQAQKSNLLQSELEMYKREYTMIAEKLYQEKNTVQNVTKSLEDLNTQLSAKDVDILALNTKIQDIVTENSSLKYQIESMKKLLDESKISKVITELLETQEKCAYFQGQFYQVELERNNLLELSQKFDEERQTLLKYQQSYCEHLKLQQKDIAQLNRQNKDLKAQLEYEQENLHDKNEQLCEKIQETNIMKTLQSQFTSEVSKNQLLESNALNTNFELNRLTVVAEYNNLVGQQLKGAVANKDKIIYQLKTNLEKLVNSEKNNIEEKSALCQELTEASYIIKQSKNDLQNEKEKVQHLMNENTILQNVANKKIEELHKMLIVERQATRDLINDHKNLTTQRNNLLSQQKEYSVQIENFKANENNSLLLKEKYETKCFKYEEQIKILTKELHEANKKIELNHQKAKGDTWEYENKLSTRDSFIEQIKSEKYELEGSIKYLQKNTQKMQTDLDELRNKEKEYKDQLKSSLESLTIFQQRSEEQRNILEQCSEEQKLLEQKLSEALSCNNELLNEYNSFIKESRAKEEKLQKDLTTYKKLNETKSRCIENLARDSKAKLKLLEQKESEINTLNENVQSYKEIKRDLDDKTKLLESSSESKEKLNEQISKLLLENENYQKKVTELSKIINLLQTQLGISTKNRDKEMETCRSLIEELISEAKTQKQDMFNDLRNLSTKVHEINTKYDEKCEKYNNLKTNFKNLAEQLQKSVGVLIEEKLIREIRENELSLLTNEIEELNYRVDCANNYINEVNEIKSKASIIFEHADFLQNELEEIKKLYSDAKVDCKTLEVQLKETTEKLQRLEQFSEMDEGYAMKELEHKSELLHIAEKNVETLEGRTKKLRQQVQSANELISKLKSEMAHLYQKTQILEFQKCELTLKYHELNSKYVSEKNLNASLKQSHEHLLASVSEANKNQSDGKSVSQHLMLPLK